MCARHPLRRRPLISPPTPRVAAPACQDYYVIAAVRDPAKMHAAAKKAGVASTDYAAVELQLASLQSVKDLTKDLKGSLGQRGLDRLVCNAVRLPTAAPPPPIIAAFSLSLFKFSPAPTNVELYKCSSVEAT